MTWRICVPGPALRQDEEVSWERQARSTLIDSALTCACYAVSAISIANALEVGPGGHRSPRHPTHFEPSSLELNWAL